MFPVGIDVSKSTLDLYMLYDSVQGRIKTKKIKNDSNASLSIFSWLMRQHCGPEDMQFVMEVAGVYYEQLATALHEAGTLLGG